MNREIIFFDTEFTHLDVEKGELLSIGMVKENGEELYIEFDHEGLDIHPWTVKKVLPHLTGDTVSKEEGRELIRQFMGPDHPFIMSHVNQFDAVYWYKFFGDPKDHPAFWIPLDFASILFAHGYAPDSPRHDAFLEEIGIDRSHYNQHNALDDARLLKDMYEKITNKH